MIQNSVVNCGKWKAEKEVLEVESWERWPTDRAVNNKTETTERGAAQELRHNQRVRAAPWLSNSMIRSVSLFFILIFLLTFELWSYLIQNSQEVHDCTDRDTGHARIKLCWNSSIFVEVLPHVFVDGANQNVANH